nr:extensin-like [Lolium perenne]
MSLALARPSPTLLAGSIASPRPHLPSAALAYPSRSPETPHPCRHSRKPPATSSSYKRRAPPPQWSTPVASPPSSEPPRTFSAPHCSPPPPNCAIAARDPPKIKPPIESIPGAPTTTVELAVVCNVALHQRHRSPESLLAVDPLASPCQSPLLVNDDDDARPSDRRLIQPLTFTGTASAWMTR